MGMVNEDRRQPGRLGELEAEIMAVVWAQGEATVQDVQRALEATRGSAYTTIMTVMGRLSDKGLLRRRKEGRAYVYEPAASQDSVAGSLLQTLIGRVYGGSSTRAIAHLIEADDQVDDSELKRLEALIRRKRRERES